MKITKTYDCEEIPNPHEVSVRAIHVSDPVQFEHLLLQPGEELKLHVTYSTVYLFVLEGKGIVEAGGERVNIEENTFVEIPLQVPHRLINNSDAIFRILNSKAPRPKKPTHLAG
jgi:mannose-6-phosphate isomerase-like protein (cupin superfamily)